MALRACDGAVSSEQRRSIGSAAAAVRARSAGAATVTAADVKNFLRDNDQTIFLLLQLLSAQRRPRRLLRSDRLAERCVLVDQRMRQMPDAMISALTANPNCRSESRLKIRNPNQAPSRAAGTKASVFQSS